MTMARLALISDTHLGASPRDIHHKNFDVVVSAINADPPDLTINCGDLSFHGRVETSDLQIAHEAHTQFVSPWRVIAGNHDVGDSGPAPYGGWGITDARRAAFRQAFGSEWFATEVGGWTIVCLNAQLMGSGLPDEDVQWDFLEDHIRARRDAPLFVAIHKPVIFDNPVEPDNGASALDLRSRERFLAMIAARRGASRIVVSGHVHEHFDRTIQGVRYIGLPSTASVHGRTPRVGGRKELGFAMLSLSESMATIDFLSPPGIELFDAEAHKASYDALKTKEQAA